MKYNQNEDRFCLFCDEVLEGRLDKKYCNRKCNNDYNNEERRERGCETKKFIQQFERTHQALELMYLESQGTKYINLTKVISAGLDLLSPCTYFKEDRFPDELIKIANYAYHLDKRNHSIIIFKFK